MRSFLCDILLSICIKHFLFRNKSERRSFFSLIFPRSLNHFAPTSENKVTEFSVVLIINQTDNPSRAGSSCRSWKVEHTVEICNKTPGNNNTLTQRKTPKTKKIYIFLLVIVQFERSYCGNKSRTFHMTLTRTLSHVGQSEHNRGETV